LVEQEQYTEKVMENSYNEEVQGTPNAIEELVVEREDPTSQRHHPT
jgi:hypothetical protein